MTAAITTHMNQTLATRLQYRTDRNDPNFYAPYDAMKIEYPDKERTKIYYL